MKTKLAYLAAALVLSLGASSAIAGPDRNYFPAVVPKASAPAKAALKSCCTTHLVALPNPSGKGMSVTQRIECESSCNASKAGKHCTKAERQQCAN